MCIIVALIVLGIGIGISATRDNPLSKFILEFFNDWSVALSAAGTLAVATIAMYSIMKTRRERVADNIRIWARDAIRTLIFADTSQSAPSKLEQEVKRLKTGIKSYTV